MSMFQEVEKFQCPELVIVFTFKEGYISGLSYAELHTKDDDVRTV